MVSLSDDLHRKVQEKSLVVLMGKSVYTEELFPLFAKARERVSGMSGDVVFFFSFFFIFALGKFDVSCRVRGISAAS